MVAKTLADTWPVVEIINPKLVALLDFHNEMDEEWKLPESRRQAITGQTVYTCT